MQGTIFQVLVLVTHGNLMLSGDSVVDLAQHGAFRFNEFVRFVDWARVEGSWQETPFSETPNEWLAKLKSQGCSGLRVERVPTDSYGMPDRMSVAFVGGGGRWFIEAVCPGGSDFWEARWELGDRNHPEQKIWRVTYKRITRDQPTAPVAPARIDDLSRSLEQTLREAIAFSSEHGLGHFRQAFESALSALEAQSEPELYGVAGKGQLPLEASRLLAAAQTAWVFGGMGSWNDLGFEEQEQRRYDAISDDLFRLINSSLVATANLTFPQAGKRDGLHSRGTDSTVPPS